MVNSKKTIDARKSYNQLEDIFNVRIDNQYCKVYIQGKEVHPEGGEDYVYFCSFQNKKSLICQLVSEFTILRDNFINS